MSQYFSIVNPNRRERKNRRERLVFLSLIVHRPEVSLSFIVLLCVYVKGSINFIGIHSSNLLRGHTVTYLDNWE